MPELPNSSPILLEIVELPGAELDTAVEGERRREEVLHAAAEPRTCRPKSDESYDSPVSRSVTRAPSARRPTLALTYGTVASPPNGRLARAPACTCSRPKFPAGSTSGAVCCFAKTDGGERGERAGEFVGHRRAETRAEVGLEGAVDVFPRD